MTSVRQHSRHGTHPTAVVILVLCIFQALPVHASADDAKRIQALEQRLDQSQKIIEQLAARVQGLETQIAQGGRPATQPVPAADVAAQDRLEAVEQSVEQMAQNSSKRSNNAGMPMHGFADVGLGNHGPNDVDVRGAHVGSLDFYLSPQLGSRTRALFELNFEVGDEGGVDTDLERAQLGYQFSDSATVWLGRFHTPYGYYNTAFHHGQQIAVALRRPAFIEFEDRGGVLPAHTVGAWLTGSKRLGTNSVTYDLYVGNGQSIVDGTLDMNNAGNPHGNAIVGGNLGISLSGALDGLKLGLHALTSHIEDTDLAPTSAIRMRSYGAYAAYDTDRWEHIAEFYSFDNHALTGSAGTHRSNAEFAQFGIRLQRYTPYVRYERAVLDQSDPYFAALTSGSSYHREALGLRYDLDLKTALKMEFAQTHFTDRGTSSYDDALIQYAIRF